MKRTTFVCDRCGQEAESKMMPEGWTAADIRFNSLPKMGMDGGVIFLDLCEPCQDELKRVWETWLKPPTLGEITERSELKTGDMVLCTASNSGDSVETGGIYEVNGTCHQALLIGDHWFPANRFALRIRGEREQPPYEQERAQERADAIGEITERAAERKAAAERHRQFERESYERVIAERKQAEIDRRKERIADIAKDRGQHEPRGRFPAEREPGEDYEASAVERLQWWARSTAK